MSVEQAKLFIERMKTDEAFKAKIMEAEDTTGRLRLANAEGYDCTAEEIQTVLTESTDATLEGVTGGAGEQKEGGWLCNHWCPAECCHDWASYR